MTFPEDRLRTGLPATEAKAFARDTVRNPAWVDDLIRIASDPQGGTVPRKASWVLRHAALGDPAVVKGKAVDILDAVDESPDPSVHRELLKALLEVDPAELARLGEDLYDLGLGLCADEAMPVAMVHVGVLLLHASQKPLGQEVAEVWATRGAHAETAPLARFLSKQLAALKQEGRG